MILAILLFVFIVQLVFAGVLSVGKWNTDLKRFYETIVLVENSLDTISIVIPFHNEVDRIGGLIEFLNYSILPKYLEILFVDDHSTDETVALIEKELHAPYRILKNSQKKGKKWAIQTGVLAAKHTYILTWDADIVPDKNYFENLRFLPEADMIILPVEMQGSNLIGKLGSVEFTFLQMLSYGMAAFGRPMLCNGANLLFKRAEFINVEKDRNDYFEVSGDDLFLLNAFKLRCLNIKAVSSSEDEAYTLSIITSAPENFKSLIQQRRRWLKKMKWSANLSSLFGGLFLFLIQISFIISVLGCFYSLAYLVPISIKLVTEYFVIYRGSKQRLKDAAILILHQFWYPIYMLALIFPYKKEQRWS